MVADIVCALAPYALLAMAAGALYLALLSCAYAEARARVRGFRRLEALVEALDRHRAPGAGPLPRVAAAREKLGRVRAALVRDGILAR
jgi:hypothetical protein